MRWVLSITV
ncbi:hypothetical protein YPPY45_3083, partial [Yersinia pestis PY-45]